MTTRRDIERALDRLAEGGAPDDVPDIIIREHVVGSDWDGGPGDLERGERVTSEKRCYYDGNEWVVEDLDE